MSVTGLLRGGIACLLLGAACGSPDPPPPTVGDRLGRGRGADLPDATSSGAPVARLVPAAGGPAARPGAVPSDSPGGRASDSARAGDGSRGAGVETNAHVAIKADALEVNGGRITVAEILDPIREKLTDASRELSDVAYRDLRAELVRRQIVEEVAQRLIWDEARKHLDETVNSQLDKIVERMEKDRINREFDGREARYERHLAQSGRTRSAVRESLRRSVVVDKYLYDRLVPLVPAPRKRDLMKYYEAHPAEFSRLGRREMFLIDIPIAAYLERGRVATERQIVVATAAAQARAEEAYAALQSGQPFETVAREYSQGLHREEGGAWGWITEAAVPGAAPLENRWEVPSRRLFELETGQHSEIIHAARSYFIVKAGRIEPGTRETFQEAQPRIMQKLRMERYAKMRGEFLQKRLEEAHVGSLDEFFQKALAACP